MLRVDVDAIVENRRDNLTPCATWQIDEVAPSSSNVDAAMCLA